MWWSSWLVGLCLHLFTCLRPMGHAASKGWAQPSLPGAVWSRERGRRSAHFQDLQCPVQLTVGWMLCMCDYAIHASAGL